MSIYFPKNTYEPHTTWVKVAKLEYAAPTDSSLHDSIHVYISTYVRKPNNHKKSKCLDCCI